MAQGGSRRHTSKETAWVLARLLPLQLRRTSCCKPTHDLKHCKKYGCDSVAQRQFQTTIAEIVPLETCLKQKKQFALVLHWSKVWCLSHIGVIFEYRRKLGEDAFCLCFRVPCRASDAVVQLRDNCKTEGRAPQKRQ